MTDSVPSADDYLLAQQVCRHIAANMAIQFQIENGTWDHETMTRHLRNREALIRAQNLILEQAEIAAGLKPS